MQLASLCTAFGSTNSACGHPATLTPSTSRSLLLEEQQEQQRHCHSGSQHCQSLPPTCHSAYQPACLRLLMSHVCTCAPHVCRSQCKLRWTAPLSWCWTPAATWPFTAWSMWQRMAPAAACASAGGSSTRWVGLNSTPVQCRTPAVVPEHIIMTQLRAHQGSAML